MESAVYVILQFKNLLKKQELRSKKGKYLESILHKHKGTSGRCNHCCVSFVTASVDKSINVPLGAVTLARAGESKRDPKDRNILASGSRGIGAVGIHTALFTSFICFSNIYFIIPSH